MRKIFWLGMLLFVGLFTPNKTMAVVSLCGWCGTSCTRVVANMACPMIGVSKDKACVEVAGACTIKTVSPTTLTCENLQKESMTGQNYFSMCLTNGFPKVCFNKYSGVYQGCGQNSPNTCTVNNTNAAVNIQCEASLAAVTPTLSPGVSCNSDADCSTNYYCSLTGPVVCNISGCKLSGGTCKVKTGATYVGDANGDGIVDLVDFSIWKTAYLSH